jgi:WD repeat-containing protein 23
MHQLKMVDGVEGRWTVTDADADREGKRMIYSSITPFVHMLRTDEHDSEHTTLDFRAGRGDHFGIWSIRFSADGSEIVAGATSGSIMVYDVNAGRRTLNVLAHHDDVNAVCFADESSTNILVSGSDDGYVKVWDRRSLSSNIPSGVLAGATEGITYASPKGDGRYVVANSKDQAARLYDLRKMRSWSEFEDEPDAVSVYGLDDYDCGCRSFSANSRPERALPQAEAAGAPARLLRHDVPRPQRPPHPDPVPLLPGRVHRPGVHLLWVGGRPDPHLEPGRARRAGPEPVPLRNARGGFNDPSAPVPRTAAQQPFGRGWVVRDVAWHAREPTLMSTCWEMEGRFRDRGSVAKHEWKGLGKGGLRLEDWVEKEQAERAER